MAVLGERPGAGAVAGLLLILAGSWLSTDGRLPPGLVALVSRRRRRAAAQSPLSPAIRRSKPAGAWILNIRTGVDVRLDVATGRDACVLIRAP